MTVSISVNVADVDSVWRLLWCPCLHWLWLQSFLSHNHKLDLQLSQFHTNIILLSILLLCQHGLTVDTRLSLPLIFGFIYAMMRTWSLPAASAHIRNLHVQQIRSEKKRQMAFEMADRLSALRQGPLVVSLRIIYNVTVRLQRKPYTRTPVQYWQVTLPRRYIALCANA